MGPTGIPYLDVTWNPTVGCTPAGPGCANCWSRQLHDMRHKAHMEGKGVPAQYAEPFSRVRCLPERLDQPIRARKPKVIGVCFQSDLFHDDVPISFLEQVYRFALGAAVNGHTLVFLTKRWRRMAAVVDMVMHRICGPHWFMPESIYHGATAWDGVSLSDALDALEQIRGRTWISYEPALADADWHRALVEPAPNGQVFRPDLFVMACESGPGARWPERDVWHRMIRGARDACELAGIDFYYKQAPDWSRELAPDESRPGHVFHAPLLDGKQHLSLPWGK